MRILLVDDDAETLDLFASLLESEGAIVRAETSGAKALEASAQEPFELIVSDVGMPLMDGYELIAALRARPATARIPAIALTGFGRPHDVTRALAAGFAGHLDKPVDLDRMRRLVAELLAKDRA